jgi:hypothetical protein
MTRPLSNVMDPDSAADYKGDAYAGEKAPDRDSDSQTMFESTEVASAGGSHNSPSAANELATNRGDIALLQWYIDIGTSHFLAAS